MQVLYSVIDHSDFLFFDVVRCDALLLHLLPLVVQGGLRQLFLLLLGPAEVGAPERDAVSYHHIEKEDV